MCSVGRGVRWLSSCSRPARVAVVGAGPAGFYTAIDLVKEAKLDDGVAMHVDILDRIPVAGGLVRSGVAPDHPDVKLVQNRFKQFLSDQEHEKERVRFFGNVAVGQLPTPETRLRQLGGVLHVSLPLLRQCYDAVILCCGSEMDRRLRIPGSDLEGVFSAGEFVRHFNAGFPPEFDGDDSGLKFDLSTTYKVAIVGHGNVGLDIARVILKGKEPLVSTDITARAVDTLSTSSVSEVHLFGRRGPAQMAFSNKELREMFDDIENPAVYVRRDHILKMNAASKEEVESSRPRKRMIQLIEKRAKLLSAEEMEERLLATSGEVNGGKATFLHFFSSPKAYLGTAGRLSGLELERTALTGETGKQGAIGTGETFKVPGIGVAFESIGYAAMPVHGITLEKGRVLHCGQGRVLTSGTMTPMQGIYASGWFKRGPGGIIGTNIWDAKETVRALVEDLREGKIPLDDKQPFYDGIDDLCQKSGLLDGLVTFQKSLVIEEREEKRGLAAGKPREKYLSTEEMLNVLPE